MALPRAVVALGFVSLAMDTSSEMIHGLLPLFLVSVLGASATAVGLIEGIGEGLALVTRVFSGALSDWLGKRKGLVVAGYLLAALSKPLFALADGVGLVFAARSLDRFGKGIRGAPRDALIADLTSPKQRGAAFGLRQSLDSVGAFIGPLIAVIVMSLTAGNYQAVFWLAVIPAAAAVVVLMVFVREPERHSAAPPRTSVKASNLARLPPAYWVVLGVGVVFTLARFSEAFLLLRAQQAGLAPQFIPLILMILSLVYALGAYPAGYLSDRVGRPRILTLGILVLVIADLVLAQAASLFQVMAGATLWGLHMAFTQGLFAALITDTAVAELRGTAFGLYGLASGISVFASSLFAGGLWDAYGAPATFFAGAGFALLALAGLGFVTHRLNQASQP